MYYFIDILRAFAALIITNSHFDSLYPHPAFSTGGAFGNAVFFIVSGFCLIHADISFPIWYQKRLLRIYPQVWLASGLRLLATDIAPAAGIGGLLAFFIYPTAYWFVASILVCYGLYYAVMRTALRRHIPLLILLLAVIYGICYFFFLDTSVMIIEEYLSFRSIFYFLVMLTGSWLRLKLEEQGGSDAIFSNVKRSAALTLLSALLWALSYVLILKVPGFIRLQFLVHVFVFLFTASLLCFCIGRKDKLVLKAGSLPDRAVRLLSSVTLEIYLIQYSVIPHCAALPFPGNTLLALAAIIAGAWILHRLTAPFRRLPVKNGRS